MDIAMMLSEIVGKVIGLREAANRYWAVELPKRHRNGPFFDPFEEPGPSPPEEEELKELCLAAFRVLGEDNVAHICTDIACMCTGAAQLVEELERFSVKNLLGSRFPLLHSQPDYPDVRAGKVRRWCYPCSAGPVAPR